MNKKLIFQVLITLGLLGLYNYQFTTIPSSNHQSFSRWLEEIRPQLSKPSLKSNPPITLKLHLALNELKGDWILELPQSSEDNKKKLETRRLLEMMESLEIFSDKNSPIRDQNALKINISSAPLTFSTKIPEKAISKDASIQTLVTLFTIYGTKVK